MSIGAGPQPSNFPYGFSSGALVRGVAVQPAVGGRVLWVYNGTALALQGRAGSDGNSGSYDSPKATIAGALLQCAAGRGDVIYVKAGHAEVITSATSLALNVAGVTVVGLGAGASRPTLTFSTATTATIAVTAAGCGLINFNIVASGIASLAAVVSVSAADFAFSGNTVALTSVNAAVLGISSTAAGNSMVIDSNVFNATVGAGNTTAIQIVGGFGHQITNNFIEGLFTAGVGGISNITTAALDCIIAGNWINNTTAASTKAITMVAGSSGMIANNRMQILSGTAPITGAGMSWVGGNYYAATIATAGTLI